MMVPGRRVRCARCGGEWHPAGPAPEAAPAADPLPPPEAAETQPPMRMPPAHDAMHRLAREAQERERMPVALKAAWAASGLVLVLLGVGLVMWREPLAHAWPPAQRLLGSVEPMPRTGS